MAREILRIFSTSWSLKIRWTEVSWGAVEIVRWTSAELSAAFFVTALNFCKKEYTRLKWILELENCYHSIGFSTAGHINHSPTGQRYIWKIHARYAAKTLSALTIIAFSLKRWQPQNLLMPTYWHGSWSVLASSVRIPWILNSWGTLEDRGDIPNIGDIEEWWSIMSVPPKVVADVFYI